MRLCVKHYRWISSQLPILSASWRCSITSADQPPRRRWRMARLADHAGGRRRQQPALSRQQRRARSGDQVHYSRRARPRRPRVRRAAGDPAGRVVDRAAPLWLDRDRYTQPVVVQSWLEGTVLATPPAGDDEWQRVLDHYLAIHALTPSASSVALPPAVLNMSSVADGLDRIRQQLAYIPAPEQPAALHELLRNVEAARLPDWPAPRLALCRVDPNTLNFVRRPDDWASVDWENSGWGDPAYEIADLIAHPGLCRCADRALGMADRRLLRAVWRSQRGDAYSRLPAPDAGLVGRPPGAHALRGAARRRSAAGDAAGRLAGGYARRSTDAIWSWRVRQHSKACCNINMELLCRPLDRF